MVAQLRRALPDVTVEPMRRRHLRAVMAIEQAVYPRAWSPALFGAELAGGRERWYRVALAPGSRLGGWMPRRQVVGYAGLLVQGGEAHVTTVAVHPAQHRRKVATRLVVALLRHAREEGAQAAALEVRTGNRGAQRLYASFGFAPVGVRPRYYAETGEDALIMWVHELQGPAFGRLLDEQAARIHEPGGASGAPDLHVPWVRGRVGLDGAPGSEG
ncbi:MAG: ribosomal protein S18-alanine N-acetyltransferase [Actinobacteria bacterium]|nr:ribosomal protein S18-alanine N-acetyltransferase [Actinomycetota bacterium]